MAVKPFILRILIANKNNGKENNSLPPIAKTIASINDNVMIILLTLFVIFLLLALANQDNNKKVMTKIIIPVIKIFI